MTNVGENASPVLQNPGVLVQDPYELLAITQVHAGADNSMRLDGTHQPLEDPVPNRRTGRKVWGIGAAVAAAGASVLAGTAGNVAHADFDSVSHKVQAGTVLTIKNAATPNATFIGQLTVDQADGPGFLSAFPCNQGRGTGSDLNYIVGQPNSEAYLGAVDSSGDLCVFTLATTHIIVDKSGESSTIVTHRPDRDVDTRDTPGGQIPAGGVLRRHVAGPNQTVIGQITVDNARGPGFISAYPCNQGRTDASNVNYIVGQPDSNRYIGQADSNGDVCFFTLAQADIILDIAGTMDPGVFPTANAQRFIDTRNIVNGQVQAGNVLRLAGIAGPNQTLVGQLTVDRSRAPGFLTAYPCNEGKPDTSSLNFTSARPSSNLLVARADSNGDVCVFAYATTDIIVDKTIALDGINTQKPVRITDTRVLTSTTPVGSFPAGAACNKTAWIEEYINDRARISTQFAVYDETTRTITRTQAVDLSNNPPRQVAYDVSNCNDPAVLYPALNSANGLTNLYRRRLADGGVARIAVSGDTSANIDLPDQQLSAGQLTYRYNTANSNRIVQAPSGRALGGDAYSFAVSDAGYTTEGLSTYLAILPDGSTQPHVRLDISKVSAVNPSMSDSYSLDIPNDGTQRLTEAEVSNDGTREFVLDSINGQPAVLTEAVPNPAVAHSVTLKQVSGLQNIQSYDVLASNIVIANVQVTNPDGSLGIKSYRLDLATGEQSDVSGSSVGPVISANM